MGVAITSLLKRVLRAGDGHLDVVEDVVLLQELVDLRASVTDTCSFREQFKEFRGELLSSNAFSTTPYRLVFEVEEVWLLCLSMGVT